MLTLINLNRMVPPIAPIALDYLSGTARGARLSVDLLDLGLAADPRSALAAYLGRQQPELIALSFRNVDDCFWPGRSWFVPELIDTIASIRTLSDAPIVLGGVGFSIFAHEIIRRSGADFGVRGDGEEALVALAGELRSERRFERVPGLVWQAGGSLHTNSPAWPRNVSPPVSRDAVDNATYFRLGGQIGLETRRGCDRPCLYCADPLAKGNTARLRAPTKSPTRPRPSWLAVSTCSTFATANSISLPATRAKCVRNSSAAGSASASAGTPTSP